MGGAVRRLHERRAGDIDQFLAGSETKWGQPCGLVLLLPHGFEGQGPEHSSARIERFLTLAAADNLRVAYPSTPASYFHLLRFQGREPAEKPLVVFTPKSLLRHPQAVSSLEDLAADRFHKVLDDRWAAERPQEIIRLVLCTGKVFYDLAAARALGDEPEIRIDGELGAAWLAARLGGKPGETGTQLGNDALCDPFKRLLRRVLAETAVNQGQEAAWPQAMVLNVGIGERQGNADIYWNSAHAMAWARRAIREKA